MIRFIYIGDQILENDTAFCFYDTVIDRILEWDGEQVFSSRQEFIDAFIAEADNIYVEYDYLLKLVPDKIKNA